MELDEQLNDKIKRKQEELTHWNQKMDNLLNDENRYYNEHKDLLRSQWEDAHIAEKDRLAGITEDNRRYLKNEYVKNNAN